MAFSIINNFSISYLYSTPWAIGDVDLGVFKYEIFGFIISVKIKELVDIIFEMKIIKCFKPLGFYYLPNFLLEGVVPSLDLLLKAAWKHSFVLHNLYLVVFFSLLSDLWSEYLHVVLQTLFHSIQNCLIYTDDEAP